jgi:hypothetical protein
MSAPRSHGTRTPTPRGPRPVLGRVALAARVMAAARLASPTFHVKHPGERMGWPSPAACKLLLSVAWAPAAPDLLVRSSVGWHPRGQRGARHPRQILGRGARHRRPVLGRVAPVRPGWQPSGARDRIFVRSSVGRHPSSARCVARGHRLGAPAAIGTRRDPHLPSVPACGGTRCKQSARTGIFVRPSVGWHPGGARQVMLARAAPAPTARCSLVTATVTAAEGGSAGSSERSCFT